MFAHSLNIAPFKDTFWTTTEQPGSPYGSEQEPYPTLQAAVATLSTGPVGPSDAVGMFHPFITSEVIYTDQSRLQNGIFGGQTIGKATFFGGGTWGNLPP